jgi:hypothetical protein
MNRPILSIIAVFVVATSALLGQNNRSAVSLTGSDLASCTVPDPCRTFDVAISKTNSGGEVVVLSTAGYGPFTVTKSVSIICPPAYHAAIAPAIGKAITVTASGEVVILRNLYLNSLGASKGVSVEANAIVHIEGLVVNGFSVVGIQVTGPFDGTAQLFVKDSEIRENTGSGIFLGGNANIVASIDHTRLEGNTLGVVADSGVSLFVRDTVAVRNFSIGFLFRNSGTGSPLRATVVNAIASDNASGSAGDGGFIAANGAQVAIRDSTAARNFSAGFQAYESTPATQMVLQNCLATHNDQGILAGAAVTGGSAFIAVSNSTASYNASNGIVAGFGGKVIAFGNTVTKNGTGFNGGAGTFESLGHNAVRDNGVDAAGTITSVPTM